VLHNLVADSKERQRLGKVGAEYARKWHSPEAVAERREALYRRVMAEAPQVEQPRHIGGPLRYPVPLGKPVAYMGRDYARGEPVDRITALGMKRAGLLTDPRIV
jgi:hypothetical protein